MIEVELPTLFSEIPADFSQAFDPEQPWTILGDPLTTVLAALPEQAIDIALPPDIHLSGEKIVIGAGTRIHPGCTIQGPVYIGRDVEIRPGAFLRSGCWIGDGCIVGASTELKRAVLFDGARAPHLNYVGDSILGRDVNLGAGTILSNFRHDGGKISVPLPGKRVASGRRKLGAVLGDNVATGCNCVLHPGVIVGRGTTLYPGVHLRAGVYPAEHIVKLEQQLSLVERAPARNL